MGVRVRNRYELELMRKSGFIAASAMKVALKNVRAGVSLKKLEEVVDREIGALGGTSAFKSVPGYGFSSCLSLNNEIVHGVPRDIVLKRGDLLSIDLGAGYKGWFTDTAWSVLVGEEREEIEGKREKEAKETKEKRRFLRAGEKAMWAGIAQAVEGKRIGDISQAIQEVLEAENDYYVSRSLIGHGVGRKLHEEPEVPGFGKKGTGERLVAGMTIAIEAIYTQNQTETAVLEDKWTVVSLTGGLAAMFEMTVIVGKDKAEVLTDWRKVF